ncbi:MAG TPA: TIGR03118 family protein [Puia sp.]|nr:TIGR03118 family protein [Puia sp.]
MKRRILIVLLTLGTAAACNKNNNNGYGGGPTPPPLQANFQQTNLVSDIDGNRAAKVDSTLLNPWGLAINPSAGIVWLGTNHNGTTNVYDYNGNTVLKPIPIPSGGMPDGGSPTGIVFNGTADFVIPSVHTAAKFIFVGEDGTISAWAPGPSAGSAVTVADQSGADAVYKGCAIASDGGNNYLYAANFKGRKIDVFDKGFALTTGRSFTDPAVPADFGPFNIANINGLLYVTYAKLKGPDNEDDQAGAGNGYVDIYTPDGKLVKKFASKGALNSPWGIAQVPDGFGLPFHSLVVGNFGDGWINVYDSTGVYLGPMNSNGSPVAINGLWALDFPINEDPHGDPTKLLFTAGPGDEQHGLYGFLKKTN